MLTLVAMWMGCSGECTDACPPTGTIPVEVGNDLDLYRFPPVVVSTVPAAGDLAVDPGLDRIEVVFDKPMTQDSWSWVAVGTDHAFPDLGEVGFVDPTTHEGAATLQPDTTYSIWFNSPSGAYSNFEDVDGNDAIAYNLAFHTGDGTDPGVLAPLKPVVVDSVPAPRAEDVDPALDRIEVTFSKDMSALTGFASDGPRSFPRVGAAAFADLRTATLEVVLEPSATYAVWITSDFVDVDGNPAAPWLLTFRTADP